MPKKFRTILLFFILFGLLFLFGYVENIKGVSLPLIKTEFNIDYEQQGLLVSLIAFAYVIFSLAGGIIIGKFGVKTSLSSGFILIILGLLAIFFLPGFFLAASSLFIISAASGVFEVSSNALATQLFRKKAALLMSLLHFFYGLGSIFSPRTAGLLAVNMGWRWVYLLSIPMVMILFIPAILTRFPKDHSLDKESKEKITFFTAIKTPEVWLFSIVLGLMVPVELSTSNWGGLYFQDVYGQDPATTGASFVSNFFILFTLSRLISGFIIEKVGYVHSLFIASWAICGIFILGFILGVNGIYVLPALGFFTAILWPTLMAVAMGYFGNNSPVMTSAIVVITGAINAVINLIMGLTNSIIGPAWGYRSALLYALLMIAALFVLNKKLLRYNRKALDQESKKSV